MPIVAASNGIKPYIRSLAVIKLNEPVTPAQINDCVGTGDYASKYVSKLRKDGFEFTIQRDGRNIVSYMLISEPSCAATYRAMKPKQKAVKSEAKPAKKQVADAAAAKNFKLKPAAPKKKAAKSEKTVEDIKAANLEKMKSVTAKLKKVAAKKKKTVVVDDVEKTFGSTGEVGNSFAVDGGWDSMENVNVRDFLR